MFNLSHDPGSLAKVLDLFAVNNINLTKIQSVQIVGKPYNYNFHVDIAWNNYEDFEKIKELIIPYTVEFSVLGEYLQGNFNTL